MQRVDGGEWWGLERTKGDQLGGCLGRSGDKWQILGIKLGVGRGKERLAGGPAPQRPSCFPFLCPEALCPQEHAGSVPARGSWAPGVLLMPLLSFCLYRELSFPSRLAPRARLHLLHSARSEPPPYSIISQITPFSQIPALWCSEAQLNFIRRKNSDEIEMHTEALLTEHSLVFAI